MFIPYFILISICLLRKNQASDPYLEINLPDTEIQQFVDDLWNEEKDQWPSLRVNFQRHTTASNQRDEAPERLFEWVKERDVHRSETINRLENLFDNYHPEKGMVESITSKEKQEVDAFLDSLVETNHFQTFFQFLRSKRHPFAETKRLFRMFLKQLWFDIYPREGGHREPDSSGFEHVFVGELDGRETVGGLHNWIRVYELERNYSENFDYRGFLVKRANIIGAFKFKWKSNIKPTGSFLIGTSPEFEMALYTFCFLFKRGRNRCKFALNGCNVHVTTFGTVWQNQLHIASAFPSPGRASNRCFIK